MKTTSLIIIPFLMLSPAIGVAAEVNDTVEQNTSIQSTSVAVSSIGSAQDWSLTSQEWDRYQQLIKGPQGLWYPKLTPPEVLGLEAQTTQEQQHFAEIVAKEEHDKLARELTFDHAIHQAMLRLYQNEPVIAPFDLAAFNPAQAHTSEEIKLQSGDHLVYFIDLSNTDLTTINQLIRTVQNNSGVVLDIFCVGKVTQDAIQTWGHKNNIPVDLVSQGRITLNQDNGKLQRSVGNTLLPYLLWVHNNQSVAISAGSLP